MAAMKTRPRWKRLAAGLLLLPILVVLVAGGALTYLDTTSGRSRACGALVDLVDGSIMGSLRVGRCVQLSPSLLRAEGVELLDPAGHTVLAVRRLSIRPDLGALLRGKLRVLTADVTGLALHLTTHGDQLDLLAAVEPRGPAAPSSEPPSFAIDRIRLASGRIDGLPDGLTVEHIALELALGYEHHLSLGLGSISADVHRLGRPVAQLRDTRGGVELEPGSRSELSANVTSGKDHVELRARTGWTDHGPGPVELHATFTVSPALLARFGQDDAARELASPLAGTLVLRGALGDMSAEADLVTSGGGAHVEGRWHEDDFEVRVRTPGIELGRVLTSVQHALVAGDAAAVLGASTGEPPVRALHVTATNARYGELFVPSLDARGVLGDTELRVTSLALPHLTGAHGMLAVDARIGFDGSGDLRLDAVLPELAVDSNLRHAVPGIGGALQTRLHASLSAEGRLDAEGRVSLDGGRVSGVRAQRLDVEGSVRGALAAPVLSLHATGRGVVTGGPRVDALDLTLAGGPTRYRLEGDLGLEGRRTVRVQVGAVAAEGRYTVDGNVVATRFWETPLEATLRAIRIDPARSIQIGELRIAETGSGARTPERGGMSATASGIYRFHGASALDVEVHALDLAVLDRTLQLRQDLGGKAELTASLRGTVRSPDVTLSAAIADGHVAGVPLQAVGVDGRLDAPGGTVAATSHVRLGSFGNVDARVTGTLAGGRTLVARLRDATWNAAVEGHQVSPRLACVIEPTAPVLDGKLEVVFSGRGTIAAPTARLEVSARGLAATGLPPLSVDAALDVSPGQVALTAAGADERGRLGSLSLRSSATIAQLVSTEDPRKLLELPWTLQVSVADRRLDQLPGPARVDVPVRVRGGAELRGGSRPLEADIHVVAVPERLEFATDDGCTNGPAPELGVDITLRDGRTHVAARGKLKGAHVLDASLDALTPVEAWLRDGFPDTMPAVQASVRSSSMPLSSIPGVCARAVGTADLTLDAEDLFTPRATLALRGSINGLRVGDGLPADLRLTAALRDAVASLHANISAEGRQAMTLQARVPVQWGGSFIAPTIRPEPWEGRLQAVHAPVGPLLVVLPGVEQPTGTIDGTVAIHGTGSRWATDGALTMERVSFIMTEPLFRVDKLRGRVRFAPGAIAFEDMSMRDGSGKLRASGRVTFEEGTPRAFTARVRAKEYPLRLDGVVYAIVDTEAAIDGRLGDDHNTGRIKLTNLAVRLPEESGREVQHLEQHVDVVYEDQPGFAVRRELRGHRRQGEPAIVLPEEHSPTLDLTVDATRPFWVRRNDFSVQLTADLRIHRAHAITQISGPILVRRGFIQLLGKSFDFERGEIRFDGGSAVNPLVQLRAVHSLDSRDTVTVAIGGRLLRPDLTFSTSVAGVNSEREILELLVRGRGSASSATAQDQAVSALSALTAGLVSSLTRRELGSYLPILAIESSTGGGTRIHAGIEADRIIPHDLRGFVQGAYVEGSLGTGGTGDSGQGGGSRGGFLIELYLPRDLVTAGKFAEPDNWSLDLNWEP